MEFEPEKYPSEEITTYLTSKWVHFLFKRLFDILISSILLVALSPFIFVAAILIKSTSSGPIFFRQPRVGRYGHVFHMVKLRSMVSGIEPKELPQTPLALGDVIKLRDDPRVTRVGRWLRRYSIDELPQLWNVLNGTMSLVGPRPLPLAMALPYPGFMVLRNLVSPGITGLFQLRDRDKGQNARYMMNSDLEYVSQFSFWLDLRIMSQTPWAILSARGAY